MIFEEKNPTGSDNQSQPIPPNQSTQQDEQKDQIGEGSKSANEQATKETSAAQFDDSQEDLLGKEREKAEHDRKGYEFRKQREKEQQSKIDKLVEQRLLEQFRGLPNKFTGEKMMTLDDVREYKRMAELEDAGLDPIQDYRKKVKEEEAARNAEIMKAQEAEEQAKKLREEAEAVITEANKTYGVDVNSLYKTDVDFKRTMDEYRADGVPLKAALKLYFKSQAAIKAEAEKRAKDILAKGQATPGGLGQNDNTQNEYYTEAQIDAMSKEDIKLNYDKVMKSLDYIRKNNK